MTYMLSEIEARCRPENATGRVASFFAGGTHTLRLPMTTIEITIGKVVDEGYAVTLPIDWSAEGPVELTFHGTIEISALDSDRVQLAIVGEYTLPEGIAGATCDATLVKWIAQLTLDRFLHDLRVAVETAPEIAHRRWRS